MNIVLLACAMIMLLSLSACGFRPLYATTGESGQLKSQLQSIELAYESAPTNQSIARAFKRLVSPEGKTKSPRYLLNLNSEASHGALAIQLDQEVTRYKTTVSLSYSLVDKLTGELLREGSISRQGGYDVVESEYAEHVSRKDTERRVARELAEDLKLDVISALLP